MNRPPMESRPVEGSVLEGRVKVFAVLAVVAAVILAWRFAVGLGAPTGMNDGYPWGIWIAFDVVTGTGLACGGYAMAILVYIFNKGKYHPLVRSALVTSALGYTMAGFAVIIDVGRYWFVPRVPAVFWNWNLDSVLLEVALCIMLYTVVLWIELSPAFLERWKESSNATLRSIGRNFLPRMERALPWIIALGLLLPTMHQSSLGSLMLIAGPRLHPLYATPLLPLLFLISVIGMGFAAVVLESNLASRAFGRPLPKQLLADLARPAGWTLLLFAVVRVVDMVARGRAGMLFDSGVISALFWLETALAFFPGLLLLRSPVQQDSGRLFRMAMLVVLGAGLYRFSTFLVAFQPGVGWSYFPTIPELMVTLGILSFEVVAYVAIVKTFPILHGGRAAAPAARGA